MPSKAIVTAIIGDRYKQLWQSTARESWERYARKHDYAVVIVEKPLDQGPLASQRSLAWQKLLVLSLREIQQYERVVWIDSDIIINHEIAPCIISSVPEEKIGAAIDQGLLAHPLLAIPFARNNGWPGTPAELARQLYQLNELAPAFDYLLNTGVLVLSPKHHRQILESAYTNQRQTKFSYNEQVGLSYEILKRGLHHPIDPRFNALWLEYRAGFYRFLVGIPALLPLCLATAMDNSFFLHFAAWQQDMSAWNPNLRITEQTIGIPVEVIEKLKMECETMIERLHKGNEIRPSSSS